MGDKYDCLKGLIEYEVNNNYKEMVNIIYGSDIKGEDIECYVEKLQNSLNGVEINIVAGMQDIYSFIVAFE